MRVEIDFLKKTCLLCQKNFTSEELIMNCSDHYDPEFNSDIIVETYDYSLCTGLCKKCSKYLKKENAVIAVELMEWPEEEDSPNINDHRAGRVMAINKKLLEEAIGFNIEGQHIFVSHYSELQHVCPE